MYQLRPYLTTDLAAMKLGERSVEVVAGVDPEALAKDYGRGPAFTGLFNGEIIALAGVMLLWSGVGEAWAMFGPDLERHKVFIHRTTKRILEQIAVEHGLIRIQATVEAKFFKGCRWIEALGFKGEGVMEEYFNGKTFIRFAKIYGREERTHASKNEDDFVICYDSDLFRLSRAWEGTTGPVCL